jgi:hypothetical protein
MSIPDSGASPERRDPTPRKPVRPSIRPYTRTLLDTPFQPFETQILQRMLASEQDFRIFCMFGRPVSPPCPGCERPVVIRNRTYNAPLLRAIYLGGSMDQLLSNGPLVEAAGPEEASQHVQPPENTGRRALATLLRPLLQDAVLLEIAGHAKATWRLDPLGPALATLCFEHFITVPDPLQGIVDIADALARQGLLQPPSDLIETGGAPMFSLGYSGTPKGRARLAEHVLPRWECARVRRSRLMG